MHAITLVLLLLLSWTTAFVRSLSDHDANGPLMSSKSSHASSGQVAHSAIPPGHSAVYLNTYHLIKNPRIQKSLFKIKLPILHSALQIGENNSHQLHFLVNSEFRSADPTHPPFHAQHFLCYTPYDYQAARMLAMNYRSSYLIPHRNCHTASVWLAKRLCDRVPEFRTLDRASRVLDRVTLGMLRLTQVDWPALGAKVERAWLRLIGRKGKEKRQAWNQVEVQSAAPPRQPSWWTTEASVLFPRLS